MIGWGRGGRSEAGIRWSKRGTKSSDLCNLKMRLGPLISILAFSALSNLAHNHVCSKHLQATTPLDNPTNSLPIPNSLLNTRPNNPLPNNPLPNNPPPNNPIPNNPLPNNPIPNKPGMGGSMRASIGATMGATMGAAMRATIGVIGKSLRMEPTNMKRARSEHVMCGAEVGSTMASSVPISPNVPANANANANSNANANAPSTMPRRLPDTASSTASQIMAGICRCMSGQWSLVNTRGDIDQFLRDMGSSYVFSQFGSAFLRSGFKKTEEVVACPDSFTCRERGSPFKRSFTQEYNLRISKPKNLNTLDATPSRNSEGVEHAADLGSQHPDQGAHHKTSLMDPMGKRIWISAEWKDESHKPPLLVFRTYEKHPKVVHRYVDSCSGRMVTVTRCVNKQGAPMRGTLIQEYDRI